MKGILGGGGRSIPLTPSRGGGGSGIRKGAPVTELL